MTRRIELLRPGQIRAALAKKSLVWLPLGTIEWHCEHLPVGLDALTAHALCLAAAEKAGGLVMPTLYYGTGGDHGNYPWTIMMPSATEIEGLLLHAARRLAAMDVRHLILFSGHFADEQLAMIDRFAADWNAKGKGPKISSTAVNRCPDAGMPPDHAGVFETTLMAAINPETVSLGELPPIESAPDTADRHDPANPIWGVIGADPRLADLAAAGALFERLAGWLGDWAMSEVPAPHEN